MHADAGREKAFARAYRLLATRPRSEDEIRRSLRRADFAEEITEEVIVRLKDHRLLDDRAFAIGWTQSRMQFRPRSKRLIQRELREKGVSQEEAVEATDEIDDDETALALARRRAERLKGLDRTTRIRRLSSYLQARGFARNTISRTVTSILDSDEDAHS